MFILGPDQCMRPTRWTESFDWFVTHRGILAMPSCERIFSFSSNISSGTRATRSKSTERADLIISKASETVPGSMPLGGALESLVVCEALKIVLQLQPQRTMPCQGPKNTDPPRRTSATQRGSSEPEIAKFVMTLNRNP